MKPGAKPQGNCQASEPIARIGLVANVGVTADDMRDCQSEHPTQLAKVETIVAQSVLKGRVVADSTRVPLGGAEVAIPTLGIGTRTDSLGMFRLAGVSAGAHAVVVRHTGFADRTERVNMVAGDSLEREFRMDQDELTPTLKLKRRVIARNFAPVLAGMAE